MIYLNQSDNYSCAPIALINAQRFFGGDPMPLKKCREACNSRPDHSDGYVGSHREDVDSAIQRIFGHTICTSNVADALNWLRNERQCVIALYSFRDKTNDVYAHYTMIYKSSSRYIFTNDAASWMYQKHFLENFTDNPRHPRYPTENFPLFWLLRRVSVKYK